MTTTTDTVQVEFTQDNPNWSANVEYNWIYLRTTESYLDDLLRLRGFVFLNDIFTALALPLTKRGQVVGWKWSEEDPQRIGMELDASDFDVDKLIRITLSPAGDILDALI